jgi:hypothetical protein
VGKRALRVGQVAVMRLVLLLAPMALTISVVPVAHAETAAKKTAKKDKAPRPEVTFTGFHVFADGSSRIWVRLTHAVNVEQVSTRGKVTFVLKGAKVPGRNNKNPLNTSHFTSSVMSARLVATKSDTELVINLKQAVIPKHRVVARPDGTTSVQIDFPAPLPGAEVFQAPPDEPPPKAAKKEKPAESTTSEEK